MNDASSEEEDIHCEARQAAHSLEAYRRFDQFVPEMRRTQAAAQDLQTLRIL